MIEIKNKLIISIILGFLFLNLVSANITISKISINASDWGQSQTNKAYIYVYDLNGNYTDPDNVEMSLNVASGKEIKRLDKGIYEGDFVIDSKIEKVNLTITVEQNGKIIKESKEIKINSKKESFIIDKSEIEKANEDSFLVNGLLIFIAILIFIPIVNWFSKRKL